MTSYHRRLLAVLGVAAVTFASCVMPTAAADDSTYEHTALVWTPAQTVVTDGNASGGTAIKLTATDRRRLASQHLRAAPVRGPV